MENQVKNAEQTNVAEGVATNGTEVVTNSEQTGISAPVNQENNEGVNGGASADNAPQDDATNAKFAEMRRSYESKLNEAQKSAEKALSDAVKAKEVEMVKSLYKTNKWTGEPIEDEYDVEEFLAMQALADKGEDPMNAYRKQIKANKRSAAQAAKEQADSMVQKQSRAQAGLQVFKEAHPDVNVQKLLADEDFLKFGKEALETVSLSKVYEAYLPIKTEKERIKAENEKAAALAANSSVAVGSVTSATELIDNEFFTKEQVLEMSKEEISKNYEKIRRSQARW